MLAEVLKEIAEAQGPIDLKELSHRLCVETSALEGMIETLVRQGKIRQISPEDCGHCDKRSACAHVQAGGSLGKAYELVE